MAQPSSESTPRIGPRTRRQALARLLDALLGPPPWRTDDAQIAELAIAWTHTQLMWAAPRAWPRGNG
jgi:hypothetical protein